MGLHLNFSHTTSQHQKWEKFYIVLFDYVESTGVHHAESTGVHLCSTDHTLLEEGPSDPLILYLFLPAIRTRPFQIPHTEF